MSIPASDMIHIMCVINTQVGFYAEIDIDIEKGMEVDILYIGYKLMYPPDAIINNPTSCQHNIYIELDTDVGQRLLRRLEKQSP